MNPEAYAEMDRTEATHWWFRARREILEQLIDSLALPAAARILEVGSGTGGNLSMLARHGTVSAMEMDATARDIASNKTAGQFTIRDGHCPDNIPFQGETFDLICLFDVLEHIEQDVATLNSLRSHLAPGGRMLLTVPAYQWLWSAHDVFLHHKRRYTARRLRQTFADSGLHVERISYFNTWLLPLTALARMKDRLFASSSASGTATPPPRVNTMLHALFASEKRMLGKFNLPAGVSLLGIVRAP